MTLLRTTQEVPMLLSAPPLEQAPPRKVSLVMYTGRFCHWDRARIAAPPRSGPVRKHRLPMNRELTTLSWPPRSKIAPPPLAPPKLPLVCRALELPAVKVMFCTISCGHRWLKQSEVVIRCFGSQVFWYRIRRTPPPLSVTSPPPSSTTRWLVLRTLAVAVRVMVTGAGPHLKVMIPPAATALTTAAEVQPVGVPLPMTWFGWLVLTARPASGTAAWPFGLPKSGSWLAAASCAGAAAADPTARGTMPPAVSAAPASAATNPPSPPLSRMP